jgi:exocyst complex protein 7
MEKNNLTEEFVRVLEAKEDAEAIRDADKEQEEKREEEDKDKVEEIKIEESLPDQSDKAVDQSPDLHYDLEKASEDIDRFLSSLTKENNGDVPGEISELVEKYLDLVEEQVSGEGRAKWSLVPEEDSFFLEALDRISKLTKSLREVKSEKEEEEEKDQEKEKESRASLINRIGGIQQKAMSYLEEEFRILLEESRTNESSDPAIAGDSKGKQDYQQPESDSAGLDAVDFPGYSDDVVSNLNKIAKEMISGGYESECCQIYMMTRRHALEESLQKLGFEKHSLDDVQKMHWDSLEGEIATWIKTFKQCATVYFPGEKTLADSVFSDYFHSISAGLFSNLTRGILIQLLNFVEGIAMSKRSAEKLFKFLDIYETLRDTVPSMDCLFHDECVNELKAETNTARCRLGEAAIFIFCDLENSIKSDTAKTPVPGGAVHPLTRYTMNYLKYVCEYKDTLEQVFNEHSKIERVDSTNRQRFEEGSETQSYNNNDNDENQSPFSVQLMRVMDLLDCNLEVKAKLYKDVALSNIFMMNNGRYILQKIKGSAEIHAVMGDTWCRKRSSDLRQYHKNYQRETWNKLLGCLNHEGLSNNHGKMIKPVLKERFKSFNQMFDEIHKTQSTWVVSDEQLQSELRVSISSVVIPAYRSFLGRFAQVLDPGRQTEKYIKFQPDDIENYIDELFDGNPTSTARRKL